MGVPGTQELLIILAIVVLLFGAKKIPDLAKGMGTGIKNFKKAMKEDETEEIASKDDSKEIASNDTDTSAVKKDTAKNENA